MLENPYHKGLRCLVSSGRPEVKVRGGGAGNEHAGVCSPSMEADSGALRVTEVSSSFQNHKADGIGGPPRELPGPARCLHALLIIAGTQGHAGSYSL